MGIMMFPGPWHKCSIYLKTSVELAETWADLTTLLYNGASKGYWGKGASSPWRTRTEIHYRPSSFSNMNCQHKKREAKHTVIPQLHSCIHATNIIEAHTVFWTVHLWLTTQVLWVLCTTILTLGHLLFHLPGLWVSECTSPWDIGHLQGHMLGLTEVPGWGPRRGGLPLKGWGRRWVPANWCPTSRVLEIWWNLFHVLNCQ